ncbi:hypothetical protein MNVI_23470 [Mycobacterium noviomagense]|nr:hypothetical protein MNVI_23470 [Mycobacterium noviomagense]
MCADDRFRQPANGIRRHVDHRLIDHRAAVGARPDKRYPGNRTGDRDTQSYVHRGSPLAEVRMTSARFPPIARTKSPAARGNV